MRNPLTGRRKVRLPLANEHSSLMRGRSQRKRGILRNGLIIGGAGLGGLALFAFLVNGPLSGDRDGTMDMVTVHATPDIAAAAEDTLSMEAMADPSTDAGIQTAAIAQPQERVVTEAKARGTPATQERQERAVTTASEMPASDDPRWGDVRQSRTTTSAQESDLGRALSALGQTEQPRGAGASAISGLLDPDQDETGAEPAVSIAETEDDVLALEDVQREQSETQMAALGGEAAASDDAAAATGPANGQAATVTAYVNMREGPSNGSTIITVVPANAQISSSQDCPLQWCEVSYEGRSGYIYEGYVRQAAQ